MENLMPLPKIKTKGVKHNYINARITSKQYDAFKKKCKKDGFSMSEIMQNWIAEYIK